MLRKGFIGKSKNTKFFRHADAAFFRFFNHTHRGKIFHGEKRIGRIGEIEQF